MVENVKCGNCYFKGSVPGTHHICCNNKAVIVQASEHGIKNGWVMFPFNFDQIWIEKCIGGLTKENIDEDFSSPLRMVQRMFVTFTILKEIKSLNQNNLSFVQEFQSLINQIHSEDEEQRNKNLENYKEDISSFYKRLVLNEKGEI